MADEPRPEQPVHGFVQLARDAMAALLPAVISGAGLAALLIGVGGAVSFARFYAAGLPANQAVNAATESDMRAIGLTWLITAGLVGLLAMLLAYIASPQGRATASMYYALIGIAVAESVIVWELAFADSGHGLRREDVLAAVVLALGAAWAAWIVAKRHLHARLRSARREGLEPDDPDPPDMPPVPTLRSQGKVLVQAVVRFWNTRVRRRGPAAKAAEAAAHDPPDRSRTESGVSFALPAMDAEKKSGEEALHLPLWDYFLLAAISIGSAILAGWLLGHWWVALSILSAGALGLLTIRVAALNKPGEERFRWYGICVFFSIGLFGAVLGVFRMLDEPRLQPVAFMHTQGDEVRAMQGIYVGESDDRLWFASIALDECGDNEVRRGSGRLRWVPRDEVSYMTIGPAMGLPKLAHEARAMLDDVRAERPGPERLAGPEAVRDAVAVSSLGVERKPSGWWVKVGSSDDLGSQPRVLLGDTHLRLHRNGDDWQARLPRLASSGAVYAQCAERTNAAWLTVPQRPYALPTATSLGRGWWRLDASGSFDPDGHIQSYEWQVGNLTIDKATAQAVRAPAEDPVARLVVADADEVREGLAPLTDDREVRLEGTIARTFPSDALFCRDCRRLRAPDARRRVRALRADVAGARRVLIRAHTDERRSSAYNRLLSAARGQAVGRLLLSGLRTRPELRVEPVGETEASEDQDHRQNRSIEVIVYRDQP